MRRLFRIAFNAISVLSLVLALLVAGLWVRSRGGFEISEGDFPTPTRLIRIHSLSVEGSRRFLQLYLFTPPGWGSDLSTRSHYGFRFWRGQIWNWQGPGKPNVSAGTAHVVELPLPAVALLLMVLPASRVAARLRRTRLSNDGRCPTCGYDLRATPDRCPECGTVPVHA